MNELSPKHNKGRWQSQLASYGNSTTHCLKKFEFGFLSLSVGFRPIGPQTP